MFNYIAAIPLFPAIGALINGILGTRFPKSLVHIIALTAIGSSFALSVKAFFQLLSLPPDQRIIEVTLYQWMASGDFSIDVAFLLDPLSAVMLLVVTGVGFLIHIYSTGYMHHDPSYSRFFTYLNLFVFAMLLLVMGNNFLMMFVGWEGVGLCSYLLIGFWFDDHANASAGKKAFVVNRVGDFGFILGMFMIFIIFGSLKYSDVFSRAESLLPYGGIMATAITLLLFVGATGKSAQIPLYVWLPDAMAGPTPVSALIHAATMVTAGVYMIARCNVLYSLAPFSLGVVATIGALTAIFAASMGLVQRDIKKVLAYSTISQLGYMFLGVGVAAYSAGVFHLMTHAFFKALLFLGAGSVIHAMGGEQDIMNMGGLRKHIPKTFLTFLIGTLAIAGTPGLAGFFSKDEILWQAFSSPHGHPLLWAVAAVAAGMTSFYMFRLTFLTFFGKERMDEHTKHHIHESPNSMVIPLMILAILSVLGGYVGVPEALGGSNHFHHFLDPIIKKVGKAEPHHYSHALEYGLMLTSVAIAVVGFILAYTMYIRRPDLPERLANNFQGLYKLLFNKYYVDEIYEFIFVKGCKNLGTLLWLKFDVPVIDGIVNGVGKVTMYLGENVRKIQTGYIQHYIVGILIGVVVVLGIFIF